jgi:predicted DsbA family dithiol-disulfide isomerase
MPTPMKIDFVSDVSCPWCVIGLGGLETAIGRVGDLADVDIHFQPFELNPQMAPEGENIVEHIGRKYGATPEQSARPAP